MLEVLEQEKRRKKVEKQLVILFWVCLKAMITEKTIKERTQLTKK